MSEEWRAIPGYPDYEVSSLGRVRSWKRKHPHIMKGYRTGTHKEYIGVKLYPGPVYRLVHKLVLEAFIDGEGPETRHLDNNPTNNRLDNLARGTRSDNMRDRSRTGYRIARKLSPEDVTCIKERFIPGTNQHNPGNSRELAEEYGVHRSMINYIVNNKAWNHHV